MEFRFRASDARSPSLLFSSTSSSSVTDVGLPSLQSYLSRAGSTCGIKDVLSQPTSEVEKLKRELLKEQIKKEILREMAERRLMEDEVRREIELEHALINESKSNTKIDGGWQQQDDVALGHLRNGLLPEISITDVSSFMASNKDSVVVSTRENVDGLQHCNDGVYIRPEVMAAAASTVITKVRSRKRACVRVLDTGHDDEMPRISANEDRGPKGVCSIETKRKATCVGAISKLPGIKNDWRCTLCHVSATSKKGLDEHLNGMKHKPMQGPLGVCLIEAKRKASKNDWRCTLCQVSATSKKGLDEHLNGKKHKAMEGPLRVPLIDTKRKARCMGAIPKLRQIEKDWSCSICQVSLPSKEGLDEHLNGKKHKAKQVQLALKKKPVEFEGGFTSVQNITWYCSICLVCFTSEKVLNDHVKGRKHKAKEELLATLRSVENNYGSTSMLNKTINECIKVGAEKATGRGTKISSSTSTLNDSIGKIRDAAEKEIAPATFVGSADKDEDFKTGAKFALKLSDTEEKSKLKVNKSELHCRLRKFKCTRKLSLEAHLGVRTHKNQLSRLKFGVENGGRRK